MMAAQSSFEFTGVVGGGGGGVRTNFFCFGGEGGVLSKFLLDNPSFSAPLLIIIAQSLSLWTTRLYILNGQMKTTDKRNKSKKK